MNPLNIRTSLLLLLVAALGLSACAADNVLRVTEYDGTVLPVPGANAAAGGCQVSQNGTVDGRLIYTGGRCSFDTGEPPMKSAAPVGQ